MGHIQRERLLKSKMASSDNHRFTFEIMHVQIYLYKSSTITRSLGKVWLEILVANLVANFQDLVAKVKNLVALVPVLGAILPPGINGYLQT